MPAILAHRNTFWLLIGTPQSSPSFRPYFFLLTFVVLRLFGEEVEQYMLLCIADRKQTCSQHQEYQFLVMLKTIMGSAMTSRERNGTMARTTQ